MSPCQPPTPQSAQHAVPKPERKAALPLRILIVEDEPVLAKNMKSYLSRGGSEVRTAADGAQALEILDSFAPDAVVIDFGLPGGDGLRIYAQITRHQARKIDCVMMSGNPTEQLARDASDLGIRHLVCKPFRISELQRLLEAFTQASADDGAPTTRVSDANHERKL